MGKVIKFKKRRHLSIVGSTATTEDMAYEDMDYSPDRLAEIRDKLETINNLMNRTLKEDNNDY